MADDSEHQTDSFAELPVDLRPRVILVRPQGGENVGSVCRAIKNMGAGRLCIVAPEFDFGRAKRMAVHARDILEERIQAPTLAAAVEGCSLVIGTTARVGAYRDRSGDVVDIVSQAVDETLARAATAPDASGEPRRPAAFVFGPEDTGLTNADIAHCHLLASIASSDEYRSINLAQAAMIVLYEFRRCRLTRAGDALRGEQAAARAEAGETEAMFGQLEDALMRIGFLSEENPDHIMAGLRALLGRAAMDEREVSILRGLARQIGWFGDGGHAVLDAKRKAGEKVK